MSGRISAKMPVGMAGPLVYQPAQAVPPGLGTWRGWSNIFGFSQG
jgi:hypothetical protein